IVRPLQPADLDDDAWADYVFMRQNPKGLHFERWVHAHGCRRWFNMARNTATDEILAVYKMGEAPPALEPQEPPTPCGEPQIRGTGR
ncbi:MAG TPA: sarcosine oxidase subunit delta, partial [Alphaproteobacteria bacterium]|nr:sarcosine oxidase subunit delta [Alphaproteobacteria bacterium]